MKKWFINKFPNLLATILIGYGCFNAGSMSTKRELLDNTRICSNKVLDNVDKNTLAIFYDHGRTDGNTWLHAEAYIEYSWARCFREELYK